MTDVLIVGASAGGLAVAEALRRKGHQGGLTVLGAEPHPPYDRPPLSKQVLAGTWESERAHLRAETELDKLGATFLLGDPAVRLDPEAREVSAASGRTLRAQAVVLATGLTPSRLPGQDGLAGVHVLRTLDDALALRARLLEGPRLVVVGEGVLGAEVAATARGLGLDVTLVGLGRAVLADQLGDPAAALLTRKHAEHGVRLRLGVAVEGLASESGRVTGVRLASGELLPADAVVVAIGSRPATGWLGDSGLTLRDGVECDSRCRAAGGVYAVGDVASWQHEGLGRRLRLENRTNAVEQAQVVAANILGEDLAYAPVPYFWTDQYDVKLQVHGLPSPEAEVSVVEGDPEQNRFVALYRLDGVVTAVLGWNMAKAARLLRGRLGGTA
ncbi:NAD(P)/FAD-dependent oxidoreductase [Nonomuraea angiospora]|uniref:NADPH-dependent 2,4-dienoyl-CoA reductase/sulfur reductase-like enzyme n=1 Tax=Nonomuraea angiospora TaxID=46172 RepID=A0ABR9MGC4_9ACTN|nr:FAD-dependent oxidoreductase [Nonomuraea angiospora]MBE1591947.1 NADPH-dependent 2,4-dienoyl-CoA reductase/sulfur reductase-like enzyme [Nonomuraea angiospora]